MSTGAAADYRGATWAAGPGPVYDRLAEAVVALAPDPVAGALVLDVGAGTGAASGAVSRRGGRAVAVDLSVDMLAFDRGARPPGVVGDAGRPPVRDRAVDGVVAAFSLTHLDVPETGLAEAVRVTRADGWVLASSFTGERHPAKDAVDRALAAAGWQPPDWYRHFKDHLEPRFVDPASFAAMGRAAGLKGVKVEELSVDAGLASAAAIVDFRLGMAHIVGFVARLDVDAAVRLRQEAIEEVGTGGPMYLGIGVLVGRVP